MRSDDASNPTLTDTTVCGNTPDQVIGDWTGDDTNTIDELCLPDCNENGIDDADDIEDGTSLDCNGNGVPDECDIADGSSPDVNPTDGVPDECQGIPVGGCCFGSQCVITTAISCSLSGGDYQGDGNGCDSDPCGEPGTGACCVSNSDCALVTMETCFILGGSFAGEFESCNEISCPTECAADINNDGQVDVNDLLMMIAAWGACP